MRSLSLQTLIDQQLWLLGGDIRHPEGNALQRFGFIRWEAPSGVGTSCYVFARSETPPIDALVCWGFAVYSGPVGFALPSPSPWRDTWPESGGGHGVLMHRFSRTPQAVQGMLRLPVHRRQSLPTGPAARGIHEQADLRDALRRMAASFAQYERWCLASLGPAHRRNGLADLPRHKRKRFAETIDLAAVWDRFQERLDSVGDQPIVGVLTVAC